MPPDELPTPLVFTVPTTLFVLSEMIATEAPSFM